MRPQPKPRSRTGFPALVPALALGIALLLAACAGPAVPPPAAPPGGKPAWTAAIGLLETAGGRLACSAVLVAPNLVATAAHCFYPEGSLAALSPAAFTFRPNLGAVPDLPPAQGTVIRAIGGAVPEGHISDAEAPSDWALMEIAPPVTGVTPVPVAAYGVDRMLALVAGGARLFAGGYGNGTHDALHVPGACRIVAPAELNMALDRRLIVTDCVFRIGDSGGPVALLDAAGHPQLVGVISGFGKHPTKTIPLGYAANAGSFAAYIQGPVISLLN